MFKYSCPLQIPQAVLHLIPYFLHEHRFVSQSDLQLHRMIFRRREGAAGRSVALGTNLVPAFFQPHSSGFSELPSYSCTWWYIRYEWNFAAAEVGGRHFACKYVVPLATLAQYILYLRSSKESEEAPPNSNTSIFSPISWMVFWFCSGERKWNAKARRSSDALNFCRADIFPIPYGFDVVSQPLAARMTGRMQQRLPIASLVCLIFQHLEIFPRVPWLGTRKMSCAVFSALLCHPLPEWSVFLSGSVQSMGYNQTVWILKSTHRRNGNQIYRSADILILISKLKFDAKNEFSDTKIHGNYVPHFCL